MYVEKIFFGDRMRTIVFAECYALHAFIAPESNSMQTLPPNTSEDSIIALKQKKISDKTNLALKSLSPFSQGFLLQMKICSSYKHIHLYSFKSGPIFEEKSHPGKQMESHKNCSFWSSPWQWKSNTNVLILLVAGNAKNY